MSQDFSVKRWGKAIVGRDCRRQLAYKIRPESNRKSEENSVMRVEKEENLKKSADLKQLEDKLPKLFTRKGKFEGFKVKANFREDMKPTQQRGRRIPVRLQESVLKEINRLESEGHIKRVDVTKENVFIQPTVITVKKDRSVKIVYEV